jgi:predicted nucleic acid-binding protein
MIRVYLDNCCFNRPFDDQEQIKIKLEAEAKQYIQEMIKLKRVELVWSYILDFENSQNSAEDKRISIQSWKELAVETIYESESILTKMEEIEKFGIKSLDALHIACAIQGKAEYFITTDRGILNRKNLILELKLLNPVNFFEEINDED